MRHFLLGFAIVLALSIPAVAADLNTPVNIPPLNDIKVDGDPADWGDKGFHINLLTTVDGRTKDASDFNVRARLAYDPRGLLFFVRVRDNNFSENADAGFLFWGDSVEVFLTPKRGGPELCQFTLSPGMDASHPEIRTSVSDHRSDEHKKIKFEPVVGRKPLIVDGQTIGYCVEMLFPWDQIGIKAEQGSKVGFQFYVNDKDVKAPDSFRIAWHPKPNAHEDTTANYALKLADAPSAATNVIAQAIYDGQHLTRMRVQVIATSELAGKPVVARATPVQGNDSAGSPAPVAFKAILKADDGCSKASIDFPMYLDGYTGATVHVFPNGKITDAAPSGYVAECTPVSRLASLQTSALIRQEFRYRGIFAVGEKFPDGDFSEPQLVEGLIGAYTVKSTYYDADGNVVTTPMKPGRYAAVADIITPRGQSFQRFRTLYCLPEPCAWWSLPMPMTVGLPKEFGVNSQVVQEQMGTLGDALKWSFINEALRGPGGGALLAGLSEIKPGAAPSVMNDWSVRDRAWWVGFKRKLYGNDKIFPKPLVTPYANTGDPAPVLHVGTAAEAGVKPDTHDQLDAICKEWGTVGGEGFNIVIARRGVLLLDGAYGVRNGAPMTTETRSPIASCTKLFAGTAMMLAVDQGALGLDDTIDKYLPPFRDGTYTRPMIRQLYTHTAGMFDHIDNGEVDLEEMLPLASPHFGVGQNHMYNGTSYALGSCILEQVSGETLPVYYQKHLLEPLGIKNYGILYSSLNTMATARDMAPLGQMLANHGAYGKLRFLREETFQQMLPHKLVKEMGANTGIEWGLGTQWFEDKKFAGHGGASSAHIIFDPTRNIVVSFSRQAVGKDFGVYARRLHDTLEKCITDPPASQPAPSAAAK